MGHGGKHMMGHGGKHMMPGGGMYKRMGDGGKAKGRLMQYLASGGMMPMDPKMAEHGMRVTSGGVMVKIMPMEEGGMVKKGNKGLKALAAKNPELKYVGKKGMKMPGGGHVFKKAQNGTKVQGNPRAEAEAQVKLRRANIDRLKKEKASIQAGGTSTGAKALIGDDKFKNLIGLSSISASAVSKLHAGYDALIAAERKQLAGAMKAMERPPMLKKGDMEKAMARAAKQ